MALTPAFTVSQTPLNPALAIFTDTSTGSDGSVTARVITITNSAGSYMVAIGASGTTIPWALVTNPISINLLTQDTAVSCKVDWVNSGGTVLYTLTQQYCLAEFNMAYLYNLIAQQAQAYPIIQDTNYWGNVAIFWTNIIGAQKAVELADDIASSQASLDRATYMQAKASNFF